MMDNEPKKEKRPYMEVPGGYIPPQAIEVEMSVLGELISNSYLLCEVKSIIRKDSFYKDGHQKIYSALVELDEKGKRPDLLLVTEHLRRNGELEAVGGPYYLGQLMERSVGGYNIVQHALIICERHLERRLIEIGSGVLKSVYSGSGETLDLVEQAKRAIIDIDAADTVRSKQINCNMEVAKNRILMTLNGREILSVGNISTLVAPPGSGKSQICEGICASNVNPQCDSFGFKVIGVPGDGGVLYVDTERSWNDAIAGIHRIKMRVDVKKNPSLLMADGTIKGLVYESMVGVGTIAQRRALIDSMVRKGNNGIPYRLVIIDGIGDLCQDVNDAKEGPELIAWLISLSNRYNTGLFTTIHDNPAINKNKARGTLGSELGRKSESMMLLKRAAEDKNVRVVTMDFDYAKNRNAGDTNLDSYITWSEEHHMMVSADFEPTQKGGDSMGYKQIMDEIFSKVKILKWADLSKKYCLMTGKKPRTAQRHIGECVEMGILDCDEKTKTYKLSGDIPF